MLPVRNLVKLTRVNEYILVLLVTFPIVYMISPRDVFSPITFLIFVANLFLTAFGYAINDVEDADDDYHDPEKRERNPVSSNKLTKTQSYLFCFLLLFVGLALLYTINTMVFLLGIVNAFVGFIYSWKPIRLKSKPILDLVSHVIFLGVMQFLIIYLSFRQLDLFIVPFLMIIVPFSMMNEMFGEVLDYEVDKKTKITNTIQRYEKNELKRMWMVLSGIIVAGFSTLIYALPPENKIINMTVSLVIATQSVFRLYTGITQL
ncbi:MAG: UbiA prenyltransferase family protein [Candidatus Bathyarchaeota archaeon]|nr:UbiA prenyltransferase family protein [Candidatus Bathyarchaeota archaeon]